IARGSPNEERVGSVAEKYPMLAGTGLCTANTKVALAVAVIVARNDNVIAVSPVDVFNAVVGRAKKYELSVRRIRRVGTLDTEIQFAVAVVIAGCGEEIKIYTKSPGNEGDSAARIIIRAAIEEVARAGIAAERRTAINRGVGFAVTVIIANDRR